MPEAYNWQLGRTVAYQSYAGRPKRQHTWVFDTNKCIACQTCTVACKQTWTWGRGQEYMLWNNVETKPYGFFPTGWDVRLLGMLGPGGGRGGGGGAGRAGGMGAGPSRRPRPRASACEAGCPRASTGPTPTWVRTSPPARRPRG